MKKFCAYFLMTAAFLATAIGCGGRRSPGVTRTTMPSPDGCYLRVWDQPGFTGASDFINGPRRYEHLRELPGDRVWKNRIKSLHLGPNAAAVVFSEEEFRGKNALLIADSGKGRFPVIPAPIQSLDIRCLPSASAQSTLSELPTDEAR